MKKPTALVEPTTLKPHQLVISQKTISIKRLIKLTNEYWELGWNNPTWTDIDKLHVLNYMRFLEQRLDKKGKKT